MAALPNVPVFEFPILVGLVDPLEKAFPLFVVTEVEKELNNAGAVPVHMFLKIVD